MKSENKLFPGRENYVGPTTGWFGLLHHSVLCEKSRDVMERVYYVRKEKPENEVAIRLHNMIYLGDVGEHYQAKHAPLDADHKAKHAQLDADYKAKRAPLYADYEAKRATRYADYQAKLAPLYADYQAKRATLDADYEAKRAQLDADVHEYIKSHIPDCAWDGKELDFSK